MDENNLKMRETLDGLVYYKEKYENAQRTVDLMNAEMEELQTKLRLSEEDLIQVKSQMVAEIDALKTQLKCYEKELRDAKLQLTGLQRELQESRDHVPDTPKLDLTHCDYDDSDDSRLTTRSEFGGKVSVSTLKGEMERLKKELKKKQELLDSPYRKSQVEAKLKTENRHLKKELQKYDRSKDVIKEREKEIVKKDSELVTKKKEVQGLTRKLDEMKVSLVEIRNESSLFQNGMTTALKDVDVLKETTNNLQDQLSNYKTEKEILRLELQHGEEEHNRKLSEMERRLMVARDALRAVNQEAEKHKAVLVGRDAKHLKEIKGMANQLQQMKKMISALTNFMALQNEDTTKDGKAATVIATQMKPLIYMAEPAEQECGLNAIYNVINEKSREKIKQIEGLVPRVKKLSESEYEYVKAAAQRTMMKIESDRVYPQYGRGLNIECEYFKQCQGFINTLNITDMAWDPLYNMCYCSTCNAKRGFRLYFTRGDPPKDYGIPVGWCRFALKVSEAKADAHQIWDKWHVAFHGTTKEVISKVIEVGYLVVPGDTVLGGEKIGVRPFHIPESENTRKIFLSPTIRYAGMDTYASPSDFTDSGKTFDAKVAFQVRINPKSYEMRGETVGAASQIDPAYLNEELEWVTNERGSTELYGILVKLSPRSTRR